MNPTPIRFGVCLVPFEAAFDHSWLQPKPTVKSWRALLELGITDIRLQFNVGGDETSIEAPVSPRPGVWDTTRFKVFITPAFEAGMKINANYCIGAPVPVHQDAAFHEQAAERFAREFGSMIDSYSFNNEPGAEAQKYEGDDGPTAERDYMRDVYAPMCTAFARGIRRAFPNAWILGCDADSADIQRRYTEIADALLIGERDDAQGSTPFTESLDICDEEGDHPYAEVGGDPAHGNPGGQDYSSLEGMNGKPGFLTVRTNRPWGITEIDSKEPGRLLDFTGRMVGNSRGCKRIFFLFEGSEVEFFEPVAGGAYSSFYTTTPVVNDSGRKYAALFAKVNKPVSAIVPGRRPGKGRR